MLLNVYNRFTPTFTHGKGVYLYDEHNTEYLDFVSGIAVNCLGHASPVIANALRDQGEKVIHISNLYHNDAQKALAAKLMANSQHERAFFCNSGTEANELAIKIARKHGRMINPDKTEIVYMHNSFHGRSMGALAITGQTKYQEDFRPLMTSVKECAFNDIAALSAAVNEKTCAIFIEPIQGESGIREADPAFLQAIAQLAKQFRALIIFDEIQCGMGRTGTLFAYEQLGIVPDVVTLAKALGGGVPIGACLTRGKANEVLVPGDHGCTYGGNPLVSAVALAVLTELVDHGVVAAVADKGAYAVEKLTALQAKFPVIQTIRGRGLLLGIKFSAALEAAQVVKTAFDHQFLLVGAGDNVVRFFPPLNVTLEEIDIAVERLAVVLAKLV